MNFKATFCDPFNPEIIDLGEILQEDIISKFEHIDWTGYLNKMAAASESDIHFSPSLEIECTDTKNALSVSAVGDAGNYEFYIFYKRPKKVKILFGLIEREIENYISDVQGQTKQDVINCLKALIRNDTALLTEVIGK